MIIYKKVDNYNEIPNDLLILADPDLDKINEYKIDSVFICAISEKKIIGSICFREIDEYKIEIMNLAVIQEFQNNGIGRRLIKKAIRYAKNKNFNELIIKTGNSSLLQLSLYMKIGFRITDVNYNYFIDNYDEKIYENNIQCTEQLILNLKLED